MPRLTKGQIASGIRLRLDLSRDSVKARIDVLKGLLSSELPRMGDCEKFSSLSRLASWEDPRRGITQLSIKTLRKHLNALYEGGSLAFREDVRQVLGREKGAGGAFKSNRDLDRRREDRFAADAAMEMTTRYLDLLERLKKLSVASEAAEAELLRHLRRYGEGGATLRVVRSEP